MTETSTGLRRSLHAIGHLAAADLRLTLTDRQGAFFLVLLPIVLSLVLGMVVGGDDGRLDVAYSSPSGSAVTEDLRAALERSPRLHVRRFGDAHAVDAAVRRGDADAGLVVPADYDARARGTGPLGLSVLSRPGDPAAGADRWIIEAALRPHLVRVVAGRVAGAFEDAPADTTVEVAAPGPAATGYGYVLPANLVLFVFVNSLGAAGGLAAARAAGITRRLTLAPLPTHVLLAALLAGRLAIALFQAALLVLLGRFAFGVHWGPVGPLALVVVLFALLSSGAGLLVGTTARTLEQAVSVAAPTGIVLGMLGGCMWPLSIVPPALRALAHGLPHAWAVDALQALRQPGAALGPVLGDAGVLALFAVALLVIGGRRLRATLAS